MLYSAVKEGYSVASLITGHLAVSHIQELHTLGLPYTDVGGAPSSSITVVAFPSLRKGERPDSRISRVLSEMYRAVLVLRAEAMLDERPRRAFFRRLARAVYSIGSRTENS